MNRGAEPDRTWLVAAALHVVAGVSAAIATWFHWLPCRGAMLTESLLEGLGSSGTFSRACLARMDVGAPFPVVTGEGPGVTAWSSIATLAVGLAWVMLIVGAGWDRPARLAGAAPPAAYALAAVLAYAVPAGTRPGLGFGVALLVDVSVGVAFVTLAIREPATRVIPLALLAWGTSVFGATRQLTEYGVMVHFSEANWDSPPGSGYLLAVTTLVAGALLALAVVRRSPRSQAANSMASAAVSASR